MTCEYQIHPPMGLEPPEWCDADAIEDDIYCADHAWLEDLNGQQESRWEQHVGK